MPGLRLVLVGLRARLPGPSGRIPGLLITVPHVQRVLGHHDEHPHTAPRAAGVPTHRTPRVRRGPRAPSESFAVLRSLFARCSTRVTLRRGSRTRRRRTRLLLVRRAQRRISSRNGVKSTTRRVAAAYECRRSRLLLHHWDYGCTVSSFDADHDARVNY
jgi:hypothetical protein